MGYSFGGGFMTEQEIEDGLIKLMNLLKVATPLIDLIPGAAPVMIIADAALPAIISVLAAIEQAKGKGVSQAEAVTNFKSWIINNGDGAITTYPGNAEA